MRIVIHFLVPEIQWEHRCMALLLDLFCLGFFFFLDGWLFLYIRTTFSRAMEPSQTANEYFIHHGRTTGIILDIHCLSKS